MNLSSYSNSELISIICDLREIREASLPVMMNPNIGRGYGFFDTFQMSLRMSLLTYPIALLDKMQQYSRAASTTSDGNFRSIPDILLNELTEDQQIKLASEIQILLTKNKIMTIEALSKRMMSDDVFKNDLISIIREYLKNWLNYSI